ncbi:hypothetical protein ACS127_10450 [Amphibacillus sp. Q70]|uniref:hypothetical protein n=1 Tax=Amphibacillus sp. Q70 TaxID=3453416 RepID=UPI003F832C22
MSLKETINNIIKTLDLDIDVPEISRTRNYWLIRTDSGTWFEEFSQEDYVAIGWDKIKEKEQFSLDDKSKAIDIIQDLYPDSSAGHIYGNLNRFRNEIKVGDVVLIPSEKSETINFGIINSKEYFERVTDSSVDNDACPYQRRRKVIWLKSVYRKILDPQLFKMMQSHHTISNATDYDLYIDKTLNSLYVKNDKIYTSFDVRMATNPTYKTLKSFINLPDNFNKILFEDDVKLDFESKIRLQSPGDWLLIAADSTAIKLFIVSLFLKQIILGGEFKFFGFSMKNDPLIKILKDNKIIFRDKATENIKKEQASMLQLTNELDLKLPGENAEKSQEENNS